MEVKQVKRGEIYIADLTASEGCEQSGVRPVLVIQNDKGNTYAPTVIVAPISSRMHKAKFPTHVNLHCLQYPSFVELEQIRTIDKRRLGRRVGWIDGDTQERVNQAIKVSLAI